MPIYLGRGQIGECQRCGFKKKRVDLVEDGRIANLLVCKDGCYDPEHPLDFPPIMRPEGQPPLRPAPENIQPPTAPVLSGSMLGVTVDLAWTPSITNVSFIQHYRLYRKQDDGEFELILTLEIEYDDFGTAETPLVYTDTVPSAVSTYTYYVIGHAQQGGDSPRSNEVTFEPPMLEYLTSRIYPIEVIEAMESSGDLENTPTYAFTEAMDAFGEIIDGDLEQILLRYTDGAPEAMDTHGEMLTGVLVDILQSYEDGDPEAMDTHGELLTGVLHTVLQDYVMVEEAMDTHGEILSGTFS